MVTVSGNSNPTNPTYPTNPTNPTSLANPTTLNSGELTDKNQKQLKNWTASAKQINSFSLEFAEYLKYMEE